MTYKHFDSCQNMKVLVKYVMNTAPPLRVVAVEASHHHISALSVGIHRVLSVTPYFFFHTKIICAVLVYNGCFYFVFMYSLSQ